MNIKQKIQIIKLSLGNLWWSLLSERYALKLIADTSVGFYLRTQKPEIYTQYYLEYTQDINTNLVDLLVEDNKKGKHETSIGF